LDCGGAPPLLDTLRTPRAKFLKRRVSFPDNFRRAEPQLESRGLCK
jgi:hypothetical protein